VVTAYEALHAGNYLDAGAAVFEYWLGYDMSFGPVIGCLLLLIWGEPVRYAYVPAVPRVDIGHHTAEQSAVAGHIGRTEKTYIIMYHLVDDGIINLIPGQVKPPAYAYLKVRIFQPAVPLAVLAERAHAHVCLGIGNSYRRFRQPAVKHLPVKHPELLLNVWYICSHQINTTRHKGSQKWIYLQNDGNMNHIKKGHPGRFKVHRRKRPEGVAYR
jgi:hypothetical protein